MKHALVEKLDRFRGAVSQPRHWVGTRDEFSRLEDRYAVVNICTESVLIDTSRYYSIDEVLDDLFMHYLSQHVAAFTYGLEWIIRGEPFHTRLLIPPECVGMQARPVFEVSSRWLRSTLDDLGFFPGTEWEIEIMKSGGQGWGRPYLLACNNPEIATLMLTEAKAVSLLKGCGSLKNQSLQELRLEEYTYLYVFRDWLSVCSNNALVETDHELPESVKSFFEERSSWLTTEQKKRIRRLVVNKGASDGRKPSDVSG